jgi:cyclase
MPLAYGGGIKSITHIERLIGLGVEKVSLGSAAVLDTQLITRAVERVGSQSVVAVIDVKRTGLLKRPEVVIMNATKRTGEDPVTFARRMCDAGVGEIVLNSVDRDGMMAGYDLDLVDKVKNAIDVPLTVLGGAGSFDDLRALTSAHPVIGAAAGSLFVFKGKFRAVLINYPDRSQLDALCTAA